VTSDPLARYLNQRSSRFQRRGRLRQMLPNEITDTTVGTYQELGGLLLKYTAVPTLLCLAAFVFIAGYVLPSLGVTAHPEDVKAQVSEAVSSMAIALFVAGPLFLIGVSYSSAFITAVVSDAMVGNIPDPDAHLKQSRKLMPKLLAFTGWEILTSLSGLLVGILLLMLSAVFSNQPDSIWSSGSVAALAMIAIVIGVLAVPVVMTRHILAIPAIVIEGLKPRQAIKRSVQLLRAIYHHPSGYSAAGSILSLALFLTLFLVGGIYASISLFDVMPFVDSRLANSMFHDVVVQGLNVLPWFLTIWMIVPVWCTGATVLYYERRTRLEGYDIEALSQDLWKHAKQNRFEL